MNKDTFLTILATYNCDKKCSYCYTRNTCSSAFIRLSRDLWKLMDNYFTVNIQGGEPTLHPDIVEIVSHPNVRSINTHLQTDEKLIDEMLRANPNLKINTSFPVKARCDDWEKTDYMTKKYKDHIRCLCYTLFIQDYESVLPDFEYMSKYYMGAGTRIDPIFIFKERDIEFIKSLPKSRRNYIKFIIDIIGRDKFKERDLHLGQHVFAGPDNLKIRDYYYPSKKTPERCGGCKLTFMENYSECSHCIDFYDKSEFSNVTTNDFIRDMSTIFYYLVGGT